MILSASMSDDGSVRDVAVEESRDTEDSAESPVNQTSDFSASGNESSDKEDYTMATDADMYISRVNVRP